MIRLKHISIAAIVLPLFFGNQRVIAQSDDMGIGLFAPKVEVGITFYFYGIPNGRKDPDMEKPLDSITFKDWYGTPSIDYAPDWFIPLHRKLDYGIFYIRVKRLGRDKHELVVNEDTGRTAYVSVHDGNFSSWPEFLVHIYSVEFIEEGQKIFDNPMVKTAGRFYEDMTQFMRARYVMGDWMEIEIIDYQSLDVVGRGWIRWKKDGILLIKYSLLS